MKAHETKLLTLLQGPKQFMIPIYQRTYSWSRKECAQLLKDIERAGRNAQVKGHFVGSVVYIQRGLYHATTTQPLLVIDGQQRMTTISLLVACLAQAAEAAGVALDDEITPKKLRNYFLLNADEDGDRRFKLLLTKADRETLMRVIDCAELPKVPSRRIVENRDFFRERLGSLDEAGLRAVYHGITKLIIVDVSLDHQNDNPQLIFESLNSTGLELTQADLIRNYVLMGQEPAEQARLYGEHWFPMEQSFGQEQYAERFDRFMRDYLTVKLGRIPNIREVYAEFKDYVGSHGKMAEVVADIHRFAKHYARLALGEEQDSKLAEVFRDIRALRVEVSYPFLMAVLDDATNGDVSPDGVLAIARMIESYVFRRAVCEIPTNTLNKTFASLASQVDKSDYVRSVGVALATKGANTRFPTDVEFRQRLIVRNLYDFSRRDYVLRKLENHDRKDHVNIAEYTIEHIMPQNPDLSAAWRAELGANWQAIHERYLHTLGNLTLTKYNSEMSDRPFREKRDMKGGFIDSPPRLNRYHLHDLDHWNEQEIVRRAELLADVAAKVWPYPGVPAELLAKRKAMEVAAGREYTLGDHKKLTGPLILLFENLKARILSIDSAIHVVVKKRYVGFRLDRNFARVSAQSDRLRLVLLIRKHELKDPLELSHPFPRMPSAKRVRIGVQPGTDLEPILALIRQAYEKDRARAG